MGAVFASLIASRSDEDLVTLGDPGTISFEFFPENRGNVLRRLNRSMFRLMVIVAMSARDGVWIGMPHWKAHCTTCAHDVLLLPPNDGWAAFFVPTAVFDTFPPRSTTAAVLQSGFLMDIDVLIRCLRDNIGDITFQEAYDRFGRIVNISVTPSDNSEPLLLNFLTAPNVLLWSAAAASCAIPMVYRSVQLLSKDELGQIVPWLSSGVSFVDGSVKSDLPMERLRELFNVNHFVVSQVNPHVVPFLFQPPPEGFPLVPTFQRFVVHFGRYVLHSLILFLSLLSPLGGDIGLARVAQVFMNLSTQVYTADITLVPKLTWHDYTQLMRNPTEARLKSCVSVARQYTFRQVSRLFSHCEIEFELDNWVAELRREAIRRQTRTPKSASTGDGASSPPNPSSPPVAVITGATRTSPLSGGLSPPGSARTIAGSPISVVSGGVRSMGGLRPVDEDTVPEEAAGDGGPDPHSQQRKQNHPQRYLSLKMPRMSESQKRLRAFNRVRSWSTWDLDEHGEPMLQDSGSQPNLQVLEHR